MTETDPTSSGPSPLEITNTSIVDQEPMDQIAPENTQSENSNSKPLKKSGIFGASSNLVNSIVGAGIIGIPYALLQCGFVAGILLLILVAWLTDKSLQIIVGLAEFHPKLKRRNVRTYEDLMAYPFGKLGANFILFNMFILAYGAMIAYLLIIKDTIPSALGIDADGKGSFYEREFIMMMLSLIIMFPLSAQRDMASLSFTSLLSVAADVVLVIFIAIYSPIERTVGEAGGFGQVLKDDWIKPTIFIGLGIVSTAMACQHSAFIVSGSLENATKSRWSRVSFWSLFVSTTLCIILGVCGYLGFLDDTQGDILNNFPADSIASKAARILLAITMVFTYPMESFVARHVIIKLFCAGDLDGPIDENGKAKAEILFMSRRVAVTFCIYIATLLPALIFDDIGPVLSITGSLGGSMLAYMAPGMVYLGINGDHFMESIENYMNARAIKASSKTSQEAGLELPLDGDATQQIQARNSEDVSRIKPWWWFPCLMPVWVAVASGGRQAVKEKLDGEDDENVANENTTSDVNRDTFHPSTREYILAIFFIVFGTVAAIAGLGSNVFVHLNDAFFSPH